MAVLLHPTVLLLEPTQPACNLCGTMTITRPQGDYWCRCCEVSVTDPLELFIGSTNGANEPSAGLNG